MLFGRYNSRIDEQQPKVVSLLVFKIDFPIKVRTFEFQRTFSIWLDLISSILNDKNAEGGFLDEGRFLNIHSIGKNDLSSVTFDDRGLFMHVTEFNCDISFSFRDWRQMC